MEKANYHAVKALECEEQKDYENAVSHYYFAAQHFLEAVELTTDESLQKTLRQSHFKALNDAKVLQKKMISIPMEASDSNSSQIEDLAKFSGFIGQSTTGEIGVVSYNKTSTVRETGPAQIKMDESEMPGELNAYDIPNSMIQTDDQAWMQDDPFVRFWDKVENLVDYLPMNVKKVDKSKPPVRIPASRQSFGKLEDSSSLIQSYYFVPSNQESISNKTLEEYEIENKTLKDTIEKLSKHVASLENAAKENNLLKSSINQFREDIVKHRLQARSPLLDTENELIKLDKKVLVQKILDLEIQLHTLHKEILRLSKAKDSKFLSEMKNSRLSEPVPHLGSSRVFTATQSIYTAASSGLYHSAHLEESE